jgi:hypothetical protein
MAKLDALIYSTIATFVGILVAFYLLQRTGYPDPDSGLPMLMQPRLLFALGAIIGTSMVMMWLEIAVLRLVILPQAHASLLNTARRQGEQNKQRLEDELNNQLEGETLIPSAFEAESGAALYAAAKAEERKVRMLNFYLMISPIVPFLFLIWFVTLIRNRLKMIGDRYGYPNLHKWYHFRAVIFGVITSVFLFGGFQAYFYFYTRSFKQPNTDSIQFMVIDALREELC